MKSDVTKMSVTIYFFSVKDGFEIMSKILVNELEPPEPTSEAPIRHITPNITHFIEISITPQKVSGNQVA
jgi:hypothetical protein